MPRVPRSRLDDGVFHATGNAVAGERLFRDGEDYERFLVFLASVVRRFKWHVDTWCLMPTHYHLLLRALRDDLSEGMRVLNGAYARSFNKRYGRRGHLFRDRFSAWEVRTEEHLESTRRYILLNPVKAGLCRSSEDWPWSWSRFGKRVD